MFYRIVLQSHAQQGAALEEVKRQFSSVTGLPAAVTEQLFATAPTVIKRQVTQADAERISQTLRAIGANVTVEPVFHVPVPVGLDPVTVPGVPMAAAAIELPPPPEAEQATGPPLRRRATRLVKAVVGAVILAGAIVTNRQARLTGVILEDEKIYGAVHIAFGDNSTFGGTVRAGVHLDGVILKPDVFVDGVKVIDKGDIVLPKVRWNNPGNLSQS